MFTKFINNYTISEQKKMNKLQKMISEIYLKRDKERGLDKTTLWLVSEIGELTDLIVKNKDLETNVEVKKKLSYEIADSVAWLLSVANLLDIDVEKSIIEKYPYKCPRCLKNPCNCQ
jgi:NTP pyrophosphatase (non-canonical NTP hydrolase)